MSAFSSGLRITGLDDFMRPEKDCVVLKTEPPKPKPTTNANSVIRVNNDGTYTEVNKEGEAIQLQPTKISLTDCLACSGCVTTAETVLIEAQGINEVLKQLKEKEVVVSISPQACASIGAKYGLSYSKSFMKLMSLFNVLGVKYVVDLSVAENVSLIETAEEFVEKKKIAMIQGTSMTMLCGACPGWICYAEKTHGEVLPLISSTKSSQQIMGYLIKTDFAQKNNIPLKDLYHVTVMSCYDKKLEASRETTLLEDQQNREVDCVLASSEILKLIEEQHINF
jgi:iron only hydrogenase large subunit-like protein